MLGVSRRSVGRRRSRPRSLVAWAIPGIALLACGAPPAPEPPAAPSAVRTEVPPHRGAAPVSVVAVPGERRKFVAAVAPIVGSSDSTERDVVTAVQSAVTPLAVTTDWADRADADAEIAAAIGSGRIATVLRGDVTNPAAPEWAFIAPRDLGEFVPQHGEATQLIQTRVLPSRPWPEIAPLVALLFTAYAHSIEPSGASSEHLQAQLAAARELVERATPWPLLDRWSLLRNYGYALVLLGQVAPRLDLLKSGAQALSRATNLVITDERWAETAVDYADALTALGIRVRSAQLLSEAVTIYPEAIRSSHRQQRTDAAEHARFGFACANVALARFAKPLAGSMPEQDADGPVVAGSLVSLLGRRPFLSDAEFTFHALLGYFTRERTPLRFIAIQENLSALYWFAAADEDGTRSLRASIAASQTALEVVAPTQLPAHYVDGQRRLAAAYTELALRTGMAEGTSEAVSAAQAALTPLSEYRSPDSWAAAQSELGNALSLAAKKQSGVEALVAAAAAYRAALTHLDRSRHAARWLETQSSLGSVLRTVAERNRDVAAAREAVAAHQLASSGTSRQDTPERWAMAQTELGWSLTRVSELLHSVSDLTRARDAFAAALEVRTAAEDVTNHAQSADGLAEVERLRAEFEKQPPCNALARYVALHQLAQRHGLNMLDHIEAQTARTLDQRPRPTPATCPTLPAEVWQHVGAWFAPGKQVAP